MNTQTMIALFSKVPRLGTVKTRLAQSIGHSAALKFHQALLSDCLVRVKDWKAKQIPVSLWLDQTPSKDELTFFESYGVPIRIQQGLDLGTRMRHTVNDGLEQGYRSVLLWGADAPTIPQTLFEQLMVEETDSKIIGLIPAQDGGFVSAKLNRDPWPLFEGIPWGSSAVLSKTLEAAKRDGWQQFRTEAWYDLDQLEDIPLLFNPAFVNSSHDLAPKTKAVAAEILKSFANWPP